MSENQEEQQDNSKVETVDWNNPDYTFTPRGIHDYRQQGPYLVCKTCELSHAIFIGINKLLVGFDEHHQPLIRKV